MGASITICDETKELFIRFGQMFLKGLAVIGQGCELNAHGEPTRLPIGKRSAPQNHGRATFTDDTLRDDFALVS